MTFSDQHSWTPSQPHRPRWRLSQTTIFSWRSQEQSVRSISFRVYKQCTDVTLTNKKVRHGTHIVLQAVVDRVDGYLLKLEGILGSVVDVVEVDGAEDVGGSEPLEVDGGVGLAGEVGDDGSSWSRHVRRYKHRVGRPALMALREGFGPHLELRIGLCQNNNTYICYISVFHESLLHQAMQAINSTPFIPIFCVSGFYIYAGEIT